jgi:hypothetical protein
MRSRLAAVLCLTVVSLVPIASQRGASPTVQGRDLPARVTASVPFKAGETLTYEVSWSGLLVAGTATATVRERQTVGNSSAHYMVVEGKPVPLVAFAYPLYYKMETLLDAYTLLSHRGSFYAEERKEKRLATTQFDRARNRALYELKTDTVATADYQVPPNTQDGIGAYYLLRARGVSAGERFSIPVADNGTLFTAQFEVIGLENVRVPFGSVSAWHIRLMLTDAQGQLFWKNTDVWMTNDARRLPVKMQAELPIGHFVLALKTAS